MSWFSNLAQAYDRIADIAGDVAEDDKRAENVLLPIYHMISKTDICITLDGDGNFRHANKDLLHICVPCTEDSSTRTGKNLPHPLHEQLAYLALDETKRTAYLEHIAGWSHYHPKVKAVHNYILSGTIISDLQNSGIEIDSSADKLFVRFRVEIHCDNNPDLWKDKSLAKTWQDYYAVSITKDKTLCYATGILDFPTIKHPKGTNMSANSAKLISCNDKDNYTFKGRFVQSNQANAIGIEASQKAHAMLKFLITKQGYRCGTQAIVAWAIDDDSAPLDFMLNSHELCKAVLDEEQFEDFSELYGTPVKIDSDNQIQTEAKIATDYARVLRNALVGMGNSDRLKNDIRRIAVIAIDAATTGRMGITFYQALPQNEYIKRVLTWHDSCKWWAYRDGLDCISAPKVDRIIAAVYGEPKGESYNKIKKQARERLLYSIICGQPMDRGWISASVTRVSQPFSYSKDDGSWDRAKWLGALSVACAIARKYYNSKMEEYGLELDRKCTDRGYLFGRLLAIADRLENHARSKQEGQSGGTDKRPTNAVRYMSAFSSKPLRTWKLIFDQLNPYIQRLNGAEWYQQQIDEIMSIFELESLDDRPLDGKYLLGYSLQRRAFWSNKEHNNEENQPHESNEED